MTNPRRPSALATIVAAFVGRPATSPRGKLDGYDRWAAVRVSLFAAAGIGVEAFLSELLNYHTGQSWLLAVLVGGLLEAWRRRQKTYSPPPETPPE